MTRTTETAQGITQTTCSQCGQPIHWNTQSYVSARWVHNTIAAMFACPAQDEVRPA